jgi:hypothetical protein
MLVVIVRLLLAVIGLGAAAPSTRPACRWRSLPREDFYLRVETKFGPWADVSDRPGRQR